MLSVFLRKMLQFLLLLCFANEVVSNPRIVTDEGDIVDYTIQFTNDSMFFDLSQYNYRAGLNNTYEYVLKGRPGHQVYIYFYTPLAGNAIVELFDGISDAGAKFNLSNFDSQLGSDFAYKPPFVKSTTGALLIRITPFNQQNTTALQDFQALATDYENPAGCDYLIWACQTQWKSNDYNFAGSTVSGANCINIIYATDILNNAMKTININKYSSDGSTRLYKGTTMMSDRHLPTDVVKPITIFDKYILLQHWGSVNLTTSWSIGGNGIDFYMNANTDALMMSPDYLPYDMSQFMDKQLIQSFTITPTDQQTGAMITIYYLKGTGSLTISLVNLLKVTELKAYTSTGDEPYVYHYNKPFEMLIVTYINHNITSDNLIGSYQSGMIGVVQTPVLYNGAFSNLPMMVLLSVFGKNFL